ncbi:hypothetical protein NDU88_002843 [Pleurodeles waltl]|uniref:Uncharacterized protein n=1 Tax=Pleurodeles waltl TaxID=8319 RepID=A0AAV7Q7V4_PLEWA|nr:hypothetical protein NDU88_002843 [Pleurodeles waltl]
MAKVNLTDEEEGKGEDRICPTKTIRQEMCPSGPIKFSLHEDRSNRCIRNFLQHSFNLSYEMYGECCGDSSGMKKVLENNYLRTPQRNPAQQDELTENATNHKRNPGVAAEEYNGRTLLTEHD